MGTNTKTSHQSYVVSPTVAGSVSDVLGDSAVESATPEFDSNELLSFDPDQISISELEARYDKLVAQVAFLHGPAGHPVPQEQNAALAELISAKFLAQLTPEQLRHLASQHGFSHPQLVGLTEDSENPLTFWLNPAYPADSPVKAKIQAVAQARLDQLCAGGSLAGKNLAEWQQAHPTLVPVTGFLPGISTWEATPAEIIEAQASVGHILAKIGTAPTSDSLAVLIAAENHLATAQCAELGPTLSVAVAGARAQVDHVVATAGGGALHQLVDKFPDFVPTGSRTVLDDHQLVALLRASTTADERNTLTALAGTRLETLAKLAQADKIVTAHLSDDTPLPTLGVPGNDHAMTNFLDAAATAISLKTQNGMWTSTVHTVPDNAKGIDHTAVQNAITTWAAQQELGVLRDYAAQKHGLGDTAQVATKAQVGQILALGVVNDQVAKMAVAELAKKSKPKLAASHVSAPPAAATPINPDSTASPSSSAPTAKAKSRFGVQHAQLLDALRHAKASHAALPQRLDPAAVATHDFGEGTQAALGGTGAKTVHTGPDGATWLAKPRSQALVHAEVAASSALARAGLPGVPVYATKVGDRPASVQPMIKGAMPVGTKPGKWTQADVDAMVRLHVASWAVGNHDVHHENVLRTADGGLVPIDGGQAFKFYGQDKLSLHYRPSTNPVHHQAYDALLAGALPKGVTVDPAAAHPVIKSFESIPDAEWRAMLHQTAYSGAKNDHVTWVPAMRAKAAAKHGLPAAKVSHSQVAEAFLDHAVERKNSLRTSFAAFFSGELKIAAGKALAHLG